MSPIREDGRLKDVSLEDVAVDSHDSKLQILRQLESRITEPLLVASADTFFDAALLRELQDHFIEKSFVICNRRSLFAANLVLASGRETGKPAGLPGSLQDPAGQ